MRDNLPADANQPGVRARFIGWTIGLAPVALILMTWSSDLSDFQRLSRSYALPVLAVEIAIIAISFVEGIGVKKLPTHIAACMGVFIILICFSALISDHPKESISRTSIWIIHILYGLSIAKMTEFGELCIDDIIKPFLTGFILFSAMFFFFYVLKNDGARDWVTDIPAYSNIRWFGYYAAAAVGLCAFGWIRGKMLCLLIATFCLAAALWTGSRGTLAAVIGAYVIAYALFPFARTTPQRFLAMVAMGIMLSALIAWLFPLGDFGPHRLLGNDDNGRIELWREAVKGIAQRPWLGWGEGQFRFTVQPLPYVHPHNVALQILFAWGVVGGLLIGVLAIHLARRIYREADESSAPLLFAALNIAIFGLLDGSLYHVQSVSIFALCIGMLTGSARRDRPLRSS